MMNERDINPDYKEYVTVDTAPGVGGYYTNIVNPRQKKVNKINFVIKDDVAGSDFVATITLQFKSQGDTIWQDFADYTEPTRRVISDTGAVQWRAIVKYGNYVSGTVTFGFDW